MKKFLMAAAGTAALVLAASSANAAVFIGLQQIGVNGGAITTLASGATAAQIFQQSYGTFELNDVNASTGVAPTLLQSTSTNTSTGTAGTLDIYITRTDITGPTPAFGFLSAFTSNLLPAGWTVQERTYVSTTNQLYTGAALGDVTFTNIGVNAQVQNIAQSANPYSVTERYTLTATGNGNALSTITLSAVPEASTWALMIGGFGLAGAMLRSRRRMVAA